MSRSGASRAPTSAFWVLADLFIWFSFWAFEPGNLGEPLKTISDTTASGLVALLCCFFASSVFWAICFVCLSRFSAVMTGAIFLSDRRAFRDSVGRVSICLLTAADETILVLFVSSPRTGLLLVPHPALLGSFLSLAVGSNLEVYAIPVAGSSLTLI